MRLLVSILAVIAMFSASPFFCQEMPNRQHTVHKCGAVPSDHTLVGWGKYGLFFSAPKRGIKIVGNPDVDYLRLVIRPDRHNVSLVLWFGPYAFNPQPDKEIIRASTNVMQMKLVNSDGTDVGVDSSGRKQDGTVWRHFAIGLEGAEYDKAKRY